MQSSAVYWLGSYDFLSLLFYRNWDQEPRNGATLNVLGPLPIVE